MSRDLTTIAAIEQETRRKLRDTRTAIANRRESLQAAEAEETALLATLDELEAEATEAFGRARQIGADPLPADLPVGETYAPPVNGRDQGYSEF